MVLPLFYVSTNTIQPTGYTGDGFHRSKDPTNKIKVLKEHIENKNDRKIQ